MPLNKSGALHFPEFGGKFLHDIRVCHAPPLHGPVIFLHKQGEGPGGGGAGLPPTPPLGVLELECPPAHPAQLAGGIYALGVPSVPGGANGL